MSNQSYDCILEKETVRVSGLAALVSAAGSMLIDPQPEMDWGSVQGLPTGTTFYVADARRFGVTMEVRVLEPVLKPGTIVFSKGKTTKI